MRANSSWLSWPEGQSLRKPLYLRKQVQGRWLEPSIAKADRWRGELAGDEPLLEFLLVDCADGRELGAERERVGWGVLAVSVLLELLELLRRQLALGLAHP